MAFPPFEHAAFLARGWAQGPPEHDLGGSAYVPGPWHERGLFDLDADWLDPGRIDGLERLELQQRFEDLHGIPALVTAGTSGANLAAIGAFVGPGDRVVCERPTYMPLPRVAEAAGATIAWVDREPGSWRLDPAAVEDAIDERTRLVLLTSPNNPTGAAASANDLRRIGDAAAAVGARVLVDQVFRELTDHAVAARVHPACITTAGMNKRWGAPGLRVGWAFAPQEDLALIANAQQTQLLAPGMPGVRVALRLLDHHDACRAAMQERLARTHEAYHAWRDVAGPVSPDALTVFPAWPIDAARAQAWADHGLVVLPGAWFGSPGHARIGLGGDPDALAAALQALQRARG